MGEPRNDTRFEVVVIGGGPAGMGAALAAHAHGCRVAIVERDAHLGGILRQCIHPGFGLALFKEELTGPEYAQRLINRVKVTDIVVLCGSMVTSIDREACASSTEQHDSSHEKGEPRPTHLVRLISEHGAVTLSTKSVVLAMGCRERTRSEIKIPGSRPAGVFTAGLAQRYLNVENQLPGHRAVILGSGDIGLIMARRCRLEGMEVEGVYEIMPYANGLNRNIRNCLDDFGIPLHLSTTVTKIIGTRRLEAVEVARVDEHLQPIPGTERRISCDTLLLSVGLVPENELSTATGVELDPRTRGAKVDQHLMTTVPGIFSCGNVLHVHDLADNAESEAERAGTQAAYWARSESHSIDNPSTETTAQEGDRDAVDDIVLEPEGLTGYVVPNRITCRDERVKVFFRVKRPVENAVLRVRMGGVIIFEGKPRAYKPSIMEGATLTPAMLMKAGTTLTVGIDEVEES